jgi:hypothetical protein
VEHHQISIRKDLRPTFGSEQRTVIHFFHFRNQFSSLVHDAYQGLLTIRYFEGTNDFLHHSLTLSSRTLITARKKNVGRQVLIIAAGRSSASTPDIPLARLLTLLWPFLWLLQRDFSVQDCVCSPFYARPNPCTSSSPGLSKKQFYFPLCWIENRPFHKGGLHHCHNNKICIQVIIRGV